MTLRDRPPSRVQGSNARDSQSPRGSARVWTPLFRRAATCCCPGPWHRWQSMPLGDRLQVLRGRPRLIMAPRDARIGVMTEHALVMNRASGPLVVGFVVTRIHSPIAAAFRVPAKRQLLERAAAGEVQIGACVIPGAEHEINLLLFHIGSLVCRSRSASDVQSSCPRARRH